MHRYASAATLAATLLLGAVACSSSTNSDSKPSVSPTRPQLSAEWTQKLKNAAKADTGICNQAGEKACAEHLTDIALVVGDLESAVDEAGGADQYPRSSKEIDKVNAAVDAYTKHECLNDPNASIQGSPCPDDARTIMAGAETLQATLVADEAKNS